MKKIYCDFCGGEITPKNDDEKNKVPTNWHKLMLQHAKGEPRHFTKTWDICYTCAERIDRWIGIYQCLCQENPFIVIDPYLKQMINLIGKLAMYR